MTGSQQGRSQQRETGGEMTGGQAAIAAAVEAGIEVCFANAGTTEIHMVEALDRYPEVRSVLGLFEGVCSGAADGYARIAGKPALTLVHLGPGFANSAANQHNARRAWSPVVNLIGDQASWHLEHDAPLTSDIDAIAGWAGWVGRSTSADDVAAIVGEAIVAATTGAPRPASAVLAADHTWEPATGPLPRVSFGGPVTHDDGTVAAAAAALTQPGAALIAGGRHISAVTKGAMAAIATTTGCTVWAGRHATADHGGGTADIAELPYFPEPLIAALADTSVAVLAGLPEPVCFFGYPDTPSQPLPADAQRVQLCGPEHDLEATMLALHAAVGAEPVAATVTAEPVVRPTGPLTSAALGQAIIACMPENAILVQEAITNRAALSPHVAASVPFTQLNGTGGAIGGGPPMAIGAAVAAPNRRVVSFQADGSGLYTIQSLWTMAREQLDISIVIINNRSYKIIEVEAQRAGLDPGEATRALLDLDRPEINFADLAKGFGMASARATTADEVVSLLDAANATPGPFLIDAVL